MPCGTQLVIGGIKISVQVHTGFESIKLNKFLYYIILYIYIYIYNEKQLHCKANANIFIFIQ